MKTFDKKDVLSALTLEEAEQYKGKEGYFANNIKDLQSEVNNNRIDTLCEIKEEAQWGLVFQYHYGLVGHDCSSLFLPTDKVKEVEVKYRPFSLEEFLDRFSIGTKISFRRRDMTRSTYGLFEGYQTANDQTEKSHILIICSLWYSLNELFNNYEYLDEHGNWQPFGVLEE